MPRARRLKSGGSAWLSGKAPSHAPDQQEVVITWGASERPRPRRPKIGLSRWRTCLELRPGHKTQAWWVQANAGGSSRRKICAGPWSARTGPWTSPRKTATTPRLAPRVTGRHPVLQTARRKRFAGEEDNATVDSDDEEVRSVASDSLLGSPPVMTWRAALPSRLERGGLRRGAAAAGSGQGEWRRRRPSEQELRDRHGREDGDASPRRRADGQRHARPTASGTPRRRAG